MKILVINSGSSSMKYQLIDMIDENVLARGVCDRIGLDNSFIKHTKLESETVVIDKTLASHKTAIQEVIKVLTDSKYGVIANMNEINAVGHRVVHGGEKFSSSVLIDSEVMAAIRECIEIAPLHNPPNIVGIEACKVIMPNTPMVAVFDTAYHQTMPKHSFMYALPYEVYEKFGVRRYGFHGTSHKYVVERAAVLLNKPLKELKIISCHLGNGASIAAIRKGKSYDTSMGFTPLEGLAMGTRSGDIDPAIVTFLMDKMKMDTKQVNDYLNKKSGVAGISEVSSDFRDLDDASDAGDEKAKLALEMFYYKVKKYIGSYAAAMGGVDAVIFTAGIGENNPFIRAKSVEGLEFIGIEIDPEKNNPERGKEVDISTSSAKVRTLVIPTNEELAIARETKEILV